MRGWLLTPSTYGAVFADQATEDLPALDSGVDIDGVAKLTSTAAGTALACGRLRTPARKSPARLVLALAHRRATAHFRPPRATAESPFGSSNAAPSVVADGANDRHDPSRPVDTHLVTIGEAACCLAGGEHGRNAVFAGDHCGVREHTAAVGDHRAGLEEEH